MVTADAFFKKPPADIQPVSCVFRVRGPWKGVCIVGGFRQNPSFLCAGTRIGLSSVAHQSRL